MGRSLVFSLVYLILSTTGRAAIIDENSQRPSAEGFLPRARSLATCGFYVKKQYEISQNGNYHPSVPKGVRPADYVDAEPTLGHGISDIPLKDKNESYTLLGRARLKHFCGLPQYVVRKRNAVGNEANVMPTAGFYEPSVEKIDLSPDDEDKLSKVIESKNGSDAKYVKVRVKLGEGDGASYDLTCATKMGDKSAIDERGKLYKSDKFQGQPVDTTLRVTKLKASDPEVAMFETQIKALFQKSGDAYVSKIGEDLSSNLSPDARRKVIDDARTCRSYMTDAQVAKVDRMLKSGASTPVSAPAGAAGTAR